MEPIRAATQTTFDLEAWQEEQNARRRELSKEAIRHRNAMRLPNTVEIRTLRGLGYDDDRIKVAMQQREAEKRAGAGLRSLDAILTGRKKRASPGAPLSELTTNQLRVRGRYGQAALLADQEALREPDPSRAALAREASTALKLLSGRPVQEEFNFFMANSSTGHQYVDVILSRLRASDANTSERHAALATLGLIVRHLGWQDHACVKTGTELAAMLGVHPTAMTRTLNLLEKVGAITRVRRGTMKTITVTPEGAYRGDITKHAEAVDRYKAEIVPLKRKAKAEPAPAESA
jgi:DNA-binding transcriptional ArsR family regulator